MRPALRLSEYTFGRPYHAALVRLTPRTSTITHTHQDYAEFFYILRGVGEHRLPFGPQPLEAGDVVFVPLDAWHRLTTTAPEGLEWINVAVPLGPWQNMLDLVGVGPHPGWQLSAVPELVSLSGEAVASAEASFRRALERCILGPTRFDLLRLLVDLLELVTATAEGGADSRRPSWLVRARRAMEREENLRRGVRGLLELAAVSPGHLSRSVRAYYGTTPTALVADLRVRHAEMLLATTPLSLTEIAARCGYSSPSYFSRTFHVTQGVSPREFRRRARQAILPERSSP